MFQMFFILVFVSISYSLKSPSIWREMENKMELTSVDFGFSVNQRVDAGEQCRSDPDVRSSLWASGRLLHLDSTCESVWVLRWLQELQRLEHLYLCDLELPSSKTWRMLSCRDKHGLYRQVLQVTAWIWSFSWCSASSLPALTPAEPEPPQS